MHLSLRYQYVILVDFQSDGWDTEPFELTEVDGKLYGRGSTDDKGPVLCWLNAIEAMQKLGMDIPVNLKVTIIFTIDVKKIFH